MLDFLLGVDVPCPFPELRSGASSESPVGPRDIAGAAPAKQGMLAYDDVGDLKSKKPATLPKWMPSMPM